MSGQILSRVLRAIIFGHSHLLFAVCCLQTANWLCDHDPASLCSFSATKEETQVKWQLRAGALTSAGCTRTCLQAMLFSGTIALGSFFFWISLSVDVVRPIDAPLWQLSSSLSSSS